MTAPSRSLVTSLLLLVAAPVAFAQGNAPGNRSGARANPFEGSPCSGAYVDHCSEERGWRLGYECLLKQRDGEGLPTACADHLGSVQEAKRKRVEEFHRAWREACAADIEKHCSQFAEAKGVTIRGCLYQVRDQVAPLCDEKLPYRGSYDGPGYIGFRDGSEPEGWEEERFKRLHPRKAAAQEAKAAAEAAAEEANPTPEAKSEAEREAIRARARERIEAVRRQREAQEAREAAEPPANAEVP